MTQQMMKLNTKDLQEGIENLRQKFPVAIKRALKKSAIAGRAAMVQDMSDDTGLPVGKVRAAVEVVPVNDTQVNLECTGAKIPLIQFRARGPEPSRGRGRGVSYSLPKGRNRLPHAFISTMPNTYRGVFERTGRFKTFQVLNRKTGHSTTQRREIIREVLGPSLVKVFENHLPQGMERADESLTENLRHEVEFVLSRR